MITSRGRIKFTAFAVWQSFTFLQEKTFANFTRSRPQVSRLCFWRALSESLRRLLNASLTPKPPLFYARKCLKPHFAVKFHASCAVHYCKHHCSLAPYAPRLAYLEICTLRGQNLPESTAKFIKFCGNFTRLFQLCVPNFPPKRYKCQKLWPQNQI